MDYDVGIVRRRTIIPPAECFFANPATVAASTTWNELDKAAAISLSPDKLTATATAGNFAWTGLRGTSSHLTGKYFYKVTLNTDPAGETIMIGVANANASLSQFPGQNSDSVGYDPGHATNGVIWISGGSTNIQTGTIGDVISIAIDLTAKRIWFRTNSGNWNNDASADPTTGTNGFDFSGIGAGPYFPMGAMQQTASTSFTADFSGSGAPAGFGAF